MSEYRKIESLNSDSNDIVFHQFPQQSQKHQEVFKYSRKIPKHLVNKAENGKRDTDTAVLTASTNCTFGRKTWICLIGQQ